MDLVDSIANVPRRIEALRALVETGLLRPSRPDRLVSAAMAYLHWGPTPAAGYAGSAARFAEDTALVDDEVELTFLDIHRRTNAIADALRDRGVGEGDRVAILCRNHHAFVEATVALSKIGADLLFLNTGFAGPQLREVLDREAAGCVVFDAEFAQVVETASGDRPTFVAWHDGLTPVDNLDHLAEEGNDAEPAAPKHQSRMTILTSGTTGTPKGAQRGTPRSIDAGLALFARIPLRVRETTVIAAPLFHAWGLAHLTIGIALSSTIVLQRRFDPEATLQAVSDNKASTLIVVPIMLQRILALGVDTIGRYDTSSLRVVASSGSNLPGELATRWMDAFGDNLYNLYGSTEVAWASIADPADLRAASGTAGRPPLGTKVRILDASGTEVPPGTTGRIFVGNGMQFEGYTGGGGKEVVGGLMSIGDLGHFDTNGLLFVEGREDDMIVSGGENVFPSEVEDLLAGHEAIADVAVVGKDDSDFGQALTAFIVPKPGRSVTESEIRAHVKQQLAAYKVPRRVHLVDEIPRNATGKVLRRELRERKD